MQTFLLKPGLVVRHNDRLWRIIKRTVDNKLLFQDELGESWTATETEFYRCYEKRELFIELEQPFLGTVPTVVNAPRDLSTFPDHFVKEALRRHKYIEALLDVKGRLPALSELPARVSAIAQVIADNKPPSPSTICRWELAYRATRCIVRLVPSHWLKGRKPVITKEIENVLLDVINEIYMTAERPPVSKVWFEFKARILEHNQAAAPSQCLVLPSRMSVYRYIDRLDPYVVDCARYGKRAAEAKHRVAVTEMQVTRILDRWEIDHTRLDVELVDPDTGKVIGRPYITVVLDRASRMAMGYLIHLAAPNTESVLRVIDRAIRPKHDWLSRHPKVLRPWPARGLPARLVPDNAAEFHAGNVHLAFNDLGIELMYPKSRDPRAKGGVERFFKTLNTSLIHCLPGTTRSNTRDRGDYPSEKLACLTLPELDSHILKWVVDAYHQTPHRGLKNKTPAEVWAAGEAARPIYLPADLDSLESILAMREQKALQHYGIDFPGLRYNSPELGPIRQRLGPGDKVEVRYRDELDHIWVLHPQRKTFLKVPCTNKSVFGMSRDLYDRARKLVRDVAGDDNDFLVIQNAYRQIMEDVNRAKQSNKLRLRREAATVRIDKEGQSRKGPQPADRPRTTSAADASKISVDTSMLSGFAIRTIG